MKKFFLLTIAMVLQVSAAVRADSGGGTDGGGNAVIVSGKPVLLDLYLANIGIGNTTPGFPLKTRRSGIVDVDFLVASDQREIMAVIGERLARWGTSPIVEQIQKAFRATEFWATRGIHVPHEDRYYIPPVLISSIQEKDLKTVAAYSYGSRGGAIFDTSLYNQMTLDSQVGLWVHEALRTIQHAESELQGPADNSEQMSDETLQILSSKIVAGPTNSTDRLENTAHLGWLLNGIVSLKIKWPQAFRVDCSNIVDFFGKLSAESRNVYAKAELGDVTTLCKNPSGDANQDLSNLALMTQQAYLQMLAANPQASLRSFYVLEMNTQADATGAEVDALTSGMVDLMKIQWELGPIPGTKTPRIFLINFPQAQQ